jgi:hypothetical protein
MIRVTLATAAGALAAFVVAWRLGGALGGGVLAGFLLGAGLSGLGCLYQRHMLRVRPGGLMQAMAVSFLVKLVALVIGSLAFRFVEAAAARADWRSFLIAFAAAVMIVLPLGAMDATRGLAPRAQRPLVNGSKAS